MRHSLSTVLIAAMAAWPIGGPPALAASTLSFPSYVWTEKVDGAYMGALADAYEKSNPDVKVERTPLPIAVMADKLFLDASVGQAPDFVTMFDVDVRKYIALGLLEPLDPYLKAAGVDIGEFATVGQQGIKDGHVYALATQINPRAMFYNKEIFSKLSLSPPKTEAEFLETARKIKASGLVQFPVAMYAKPGDADTIYRQFGPILSAFDATIYRDGKPTANDEKVVAALGFYKELFDEGLIPKGLDMNLVRTLFGQGKAAMIVDGAFLAGTIKDEDRAVYDNLLSVPFRFAGNSAMSVSVFLGVPKKAKSKDAAARMLTLMLSDEWQKRVVTDVDAIPLRARIMPADFVQDNKWFAAFQEVGPQARSYAPDGAEDIAPEVVKATAKNLEAMLFGGLTAEQTSDNLQRDLLALKH